MSNIKIERISESNLKVIENIETQCFGKEAYTSALIINDYKNELCHMYVGTVDGKIFGYINFLLVNGEAELIRIAVLPQYQNRGLGTKLLELTYQYISNDIDNLFLEVSANNSNAIKLYKSFGFVEINRRKNYYRDGSEAIIMEYQKALSK